MENLDPIADAILRVSDACSQPPRDFRLEIAFLNSRIEKTIRLCGESELQICEERTGMWPMPLQYAQFKFLQEDWRTFWEMVEKLEVWSWGRYHRSAHDGWKWSLELANADRRVQAGGRNASPPGFQEFSSTVNRLMERRMGP